MFFFYLYFADINIEPPSTRFKVTWVRWGVWVMILHSWILNSLQVIRDLKIYHKEYYCKSIPRIYISYFTSSLEALQYHMPFDSIKVLCLIEETHRYINLHIDTFGNLIFHTMSDFFFLLSNVMDFIHNSHSLTSFPCDVVQKKKK